VTAAPAPTAPIVARELPADLSIELERTWCYGSCPTYKVKVDGSGLVTWDGLTYVDSKGTQGALISVDALLALVTRFDAIGFSKLHDSYNVTVTDVPSAILTLVRGGLTKTVSVRGADVARRGQGSLVLNDNSGDHAVLNKSDGANYESAVATFRALDELANAIDSALGTSKWIGSAPQKRHR
jgi:hypothetical protein